jgi:hypothetical protein
MNNSQARKNKPAFSGVLMYFPDAILAIAEHSRKGNSKHNPGQPMHWAKEKSTDHADCVARHLIDIGSEWNGVDPETGSYHATALAWRALALLQTVLEKEAKSVASIPAKEIIYPTPGPNCPCFDCKKMYGKLDDASPWDKENDFIAP